jgi:hypothetical protein
MFSAYVNLAVNHLPLVKHPANLLEGFFSAEKTAGGLSEKTVRIYPPALSAVRLFLQNAIGSGESCRTT